MTPSPLPALVEERVYVFLPSYNKLLESFLKYKPSRTNPGWIVTLPPSESSLADWLLYPMHTHRGFPELPKSTLQTIDLVVILVYRSGLSSSLESKFQDHFPISPSDSEHNRHLNPFGNVQEQSSQSFIFWITETSRERSFISKGGKRITRRPCG